MIAALLLAWPLGQEPDPDPLAELRALLDASCVACHGGESPEAELDLAADLGPALADDPELWRELAERVARGEMPPAKAEAPTPTLAPTLTPAERERLVALVTSLLGPPPPPRASTLRRLTRFELERCVEGLLGVRYDASRTFPRDAAGHGFDSVGDVMFLTDLLVEKYFDAAAEIADAAYAGEDARARLAGEPSDVLQRILSLAFRRAPTADELAARLALVTQDEQPLHAALLSVLLSPHFLFRVEADHDADTPQPLDACELATRLALLVWGRGPDEELLALAGAGKLDSDEVLRAQLARLIDDPRSRALADGFAAQWLGFRSILDEAVDIRTYRGFTPALKRSMYEESALCFDALVREDLPLTELVAARWTYADRALAKHYVLDVQPKGFQRVMLTDPRRGGILGQASILTLTSHPDRTSPVLRGAWILDTLLDDPSPPPPPDAGALPPERKEDIGEDSGPTVRERLERHRADARCASCHARIDPLGFALEGFDGVGRLRETEKGEAVDARGVLPDGTEVAGVVELGQYLAGRPADLARAFTRRLFVYAIGRPPEAWDEPALEQILQAGARNEWRTRALLEAFVLSPPFRTRGVSAR